MKKGQSQAGTKWLYYFVVVIIVAVIFGFFTAQIQNNIVKSTFCIEEVENNLIMSETLYSSNCLAYYDEELKRTIPGTIDKNKFTEEQISSCFKFIKQDVQLKLQETTIGDEISDPETKTRLVQVYDQDTTTLANLEFNFPKKKC